MTWKPHLAGNGSGDSGAPPPVLTVAQMREADRRAVEEFGIPGVVLMENAGRGAAEIAARMLDESDGRRALVIAGRGNNGGDGYVIARHLRNASRDVSVRVLAKLDDVAGDARVHLDVIRRMGIDVRETRLPDERKSLAAELGRCDLVVDAMLGTGTAGDIREPFRTAIDLVNASGVPVLAVDIPSGMDGDTGEILGTCVIATHTATFAAVKAGMNNPSAAQYVGLLSIIDIGIPRDLLSPGGP
jgi:NAD(P)H-hydrate epimerase